MTALDHVHHVRPWRTALRLLVLLSLVASTWLAGGQTPTQAHNVTGYIFIQQAPTTIMEGTMAEYRICRSSKSNHFARVYGYVDWEVRYARRDSSDTKTKASAADFTTATSGRYTFPQRRSCGWIKIGTSSNGVAQDDREFQLVLTGFYQHFHAPNGLGTTASLWVTIQDDDRLEFHHGHESVDEGGRATYKACRQVPSRHASKTSQRWEVRFDKRNEQDTAVKASSSDVSTRGNVTIAANEDCGIFTVRTTGDDDAEPTEEFEVVLIESLYASYGAAAASGSTLRTWTQIVDDDSGKIIVEDASVIEGGTLEFTVKTQDYKKGVWFLATPHLAMVTTEDSDWRQPPNRYYPNTLPSIRLGDSESETRTVRVETVDDNIDENDETFTLRLGVPDLVQIDASDTGTGTIIDDDTAVLTIDDVTATEGSDATYTVSLGEASTEGPFTVWVTSKDGTARNNQDFHSGTQGHSFVGTAHESHSGNIYIFSDDAEEGTETINLSLTATGPDIPVDSSDTAVISVEDGVPTVPTLTIADASTTEGGVLEFRISQNNILIHPEYGAYTIGVNTDSTSTASASDHGAITCHQINADGTIGEEFSLESSTPANHHCLIHGGANEAVLLRIQTTQDSDAETDETIELGLDYKFYSQFGPPEGFTATDTAVGTILNDDIPAVGFTAQSTTVDEGSQFDYMLTMGEVSTGPFSVRVQTSSDTAADGSDYTSTSQVFDFTGTAGQSHSGSIPILFDRDDTEGAETFSLVFSIDDGGNAGNGESNTGSGNGNAGNGGESNTGNGSSNAGNSNASNGNGNSNASNGNGDSNASNGNAGSDVPPELPTTQEITINDIEVATVTISDATAAEGDYLDFKIVQNDVSMQNSGQGGYTVGVEVLSSGTADAADHGSFVCYQSTPQGEIDTTRTHQIEGWRQLQSSVPDDHYCVFSGAADQTAWLRLATTEDLTIEPDETIELQLKYKFYNKTAISDYFGPQTDMDTAVGTITNDDITSVPVNIGSNGAPNWLNDNSTTAEQ